MIGRAKRGPLSSGHSRPNETGLAKKKNENSREASTHTHDPSHESSDLSHKICVCPVLGSDLNLASCVPSLLSHLHNTFT
jgi:hypothetical protein